MPEAKLALDFGQFPMTALALAALPNCARISGSLANATLSFLITCVGRIFSMPNNTAGCRPKALACTKQRRRTKGCRVTCPPYTLSCWVKQYTAKTRTCCARLAGTAARLGLGRSTKPGSGSNTTIGSGARRTSELTSCNAKATQTQPHCQAKQQSSSTSTNCCRYDKIAASNCDAPASSATGPRPTKSSFMQMPCAFNHETVALNTSAPHNQPLLFNSAGSGLISEDKHQMSSQGSCICLHCTHKGTCKNIRQSALKTGGCLSYMWRNSGKCSCTVMPH